MKGVYNIPLAFRLRGDVNEAALVRSLDDLHRRHEALRTHFERRNGSVVQVIDPPGLALSVEAVSAAEVQALARAERHHAFDLWREQLCRIRLLRQVDGNPGAAGDYVVLVTMHHSVSDGWSVGIFFRELMSLYQAYAKGENSPLAPLPIQYADYAQWQRRWLRGDVIERQLSYWREQLADLPQLLTLPTARPRPAEQTFRGAAESFLLPAALAAKLQALSRQQGVTMFMTLLSAWAVLLGRYAGQRDVAIGTPIANRTRRETEALIGFLANTLVMRNDLRGDPRFTELLERTRVMALQAYAHQDIPFELLVEKLNPARSLSHSPLFQVMFILQNMPFGTLTLPGLMVELLEGEATPEVAEGTSAGTARFDLTLSMQESAVGLVGGLEYNTDLFERDSIRRMIEHFVRLLEAVVEAPDARLSRLGMLGEEERRQQVIQWNATARKYPSARCIHELFEAQARLRPDSIALVHEGREISYGKLNLLANILARELVSRGVGPEARVGLCVNRNPSMVIGILGILKAGGCYVPLDPEFPRKRLDYLLEDARVGLVLSEPDVANCVAGAAREILLLNEVSAPVVSQDPPCGNVDSQARGLLPDHPAYLIYTSASTGAPKGVLGLHRSLVNRVHWLARTRGVGPDEVLCQKTSLGFVDHVAEIFQALSAGVPLVIISPAVLQAPPRLLHELDAHRVSQLTLVPSLLKTVLAAGSGARARCVRSIHSSGEALHVSGLQRLAECFPSARLFNIYGSTEVGADVTCHEVVAESLRGTGAGQWASIGAGIDNTQAYILDSDGELVVAGATGELHIGGVCLARGYFERAGLTAEKFVPSPHARTAGERLYRTGDLARWRRDGTIEYLGRADSQVKVRGFRIELGEIESALRANKAVRDAVVVARQDAAGDTRLVGYVVPQADAPVDEAVFTKALIRQLQELLPGHLVPSALVVLERLPRTTTGKLDRRALPERAAPAVEHVPPAGATEELLAQIWCVLLKRTRAGRHENFFELGGHSLLAMQLATRIRETFATELPVRELFEHPTLAAQARAVERARGIGALIELPIDSVSRHAPLPLSHAQQRLWYLQQYMGPSAAYNMPLALRLRGEVDEAALLRSLEDLHRRHESLRTRIETCDGKPMQVIDPPGLGLQVEVVRVDEARAIAHAEILHPFTLSGEPLCRVRLLRESGGSGDHLLLVTMHHSVSDGWSLGIFLRELLGSYRAYANGEDVPLAPLPIQYADYAQWQRQWLRGELLEQQVSYWREQLKELPPLLTLPTDRPRPIEPRFRGGLERVALPAVLTERLQALSLEHGVTLYMTLLSTFAVLLGRYSGQQDLAIGTPIANRTRRETEGLIGFFVNTLVTRHDLRGDPSFAELLRRTREMALQAYAHQDVPFEQLVEELNPARSTSHSPLFQVAFGLVNAPFETIELPGLAVLPLQDDAGEQGHATARFDLTLNIQESPAGLVGVLEYDTDLFERQTARRMLAHYEKLLEAIVAAPRARLSRLPMLTEPERRRQLLEWNATSRPYPRENCVHELFEEQARLRPDSVAVVHESSSVTYAELNRRANQLAHALRAKGVGPDARVGICMLRSPELAVGLLGILKAGGAYVPLDPEYPRPRLEYMLAQSGCGVVLGQSGIAADLPLPGGAVPVWLDADSHDTTFGGFSDANVARAGSGAHPANLAYVMYTSGSTGEPKGSAIVHENISRLVHSDFLDLSSARTILCAASPSFDAFTFELWGALLRGGRSVMLSATREGFAELGEVVLREHVDCAWLTSSLFNQLIGDSAFALRNLDHLLVGGEALSIVHVREGLRLLPRTTLINGYGPTENTTFSTVYAISHDALTDRATVPIGRPIGNTQAYVLDAAGELVPQGAVGELYLGGAGLARGYLGRAGLTAEKFVPHAFACTVGERLYRTGDLVRQTSDGNLEFIGRVDHQVKLRGFRIELGEIEAALRTHAALHDAVVVLREEAGDKRLVAYVVAVPGTTMADADLVSELRRHLSRQSPAYMVPSSWRVLESLPLTANGKVDRASLPAPLALVSGPEQMSPAGPTEQLLAQIWCALLQRECVGRHESFFELGGHSLLATQLVSRVRETFSAGLSLRQVFEHATLASQAAAIERTRGGDTRIDAAIEPASREQSLPLSFAQQRMWFLFQYMGPSAVYNMPLALRLRGEVNEGALSRSLEELHRRHESFRTRFEARGGDIVQVIDPPGLDLRVEATPAADVEAIVQAERDYCFDLSRERLCRFRVLREISGDATAGDYVLLLTSHHSVSDGWSLGIFFRELVSLYRAYSSGAESPLAPLPIQYVDYAQWQRRELQGEVLARQVAYWRTQLRELPPLLTLPSDRPRPAEQTFRGRIERVALPPELSAQLQTLSREQGVTLYMTLLSAFGVLLSRYSGQKDVAIGTPIANRTRHETEGLIGFFVNTLVMRLDLDGDPSFTDVLKCTREAALQAYAHQDVPFEQLVEELNPERSLSHSPLFQVMFAMQNVPFEAIELPGLTLHPFRTQGSDDDAPEGVARFDLTLNMQETPSGLIGVLVYNSDLFERGTVRRMWEHYSRLLAAIVAAPRSRLSQLKMLDLGERRLLLEDWNSTLQPYRDDRCIHEVFAEQALRSPDAIAVIYEEQQLSYAELDRRSNQLAHALRDRDVRPDTRVAICVERSVEMLIGILGILKAGGAYVPLDPTYPPERLEYLLNDAAPVAVLTQERFRGRLHANIVPRIALDTDWAHIGTKPSEAPEAGVRPHHLAYVIYTSGSTGQPKGVTISHGSIRERMRYVQSMLDFGPVDRLLQKTPLTFDVSVRELLLPLHAGACLVVARPEAHRDSYYIADAIRRYAVTVVHFVPSMFEGFVLAGVAAGCTSLRHILCGGEVLTPSLVAPLFAQLDCRLHNFYGPTETAIFATHHECSRGSSGSVPIGRPVANTRIYLLDAEQEPVPLGVVGEIYIGGAGLARGYMNRPALTAARFIADPFGDQPGARLYRTGDLGRWRADGNVEYLGRNDSQVKIRGYRIELGEIESQLGRHGRVTEAVVLAREVTPGEKRLVAYCTGDALGVDELRAHLRARMPEYMVPSAFVVLDHMPLTTNGKVDRKALPAPAVMESDPAPAPAEGPTEELLSALWCAVLKRERVGRHADFFELGGHSLLATQLVTRIRETFSAEFSVRQVFEHPTLSSQARAVEVARGVGTPCDLRIDPVSREAPIPLSFAQQRLWFLHQLMGPSAVYNLPLALRLKGELDEVALVRALEELCRRHESLRTRFEQRGDGVVQVIDPPGLALEVEAVPAVAVRDMARAEHAHCFDLARDRLCRIRLLRETDAPGDHVLLATMHHSVSDGWSLGILVREFVHLYHAHALGEEARLAPLPIQYADYAQWQRRWLQGATLERQVSYWRDQLKHLPSRLLLPTDHSRPAEQSFRGTVQRVALPRVLSEQVQALSRERGVTPYMTLLSAFAVLLGRYAGQNDLAIGTPIANRTRRETEGLIGFFVNTLVMRHRLGGDPRFVDLLRATRAMALQAYAHQDVPFEQLVDELNPERSLGHSPLFQVAFGLQNVPADAVESPGLSLRPLFEQGGEDEAGTARFDLTLSLQESPAGLAGVIEYNTDLFERGTIQRLWTHYARLLESIVAAPQSRLSQLELMDGEERRQLLEWTAAPSRFPRDKSIPRLFEEAALRDPDAVVMTDAGHELSYGEIDGCANQLAHALMALGVRPGARVAICTERDAERVVGVLGILKTGAAFVPMSAQPAERFDHLREDSGAAVVVTSSTVRDALLRHPRTPPGVEVRATDLACVCYETCEAGVPLGRMISHAGVLETAADLIDSLCACPVEVGVSTTNRARAGAWRVLSSEGALLPRVAVGELHRAGEGAGWGYLHRPALTAEHFVPDAFGGVPGARLHRTGEHARWGADGSIEVVASRTVSAHDQELEWCDVERALSGQAALREAVVIPFESGQQLAAYVVPREAGSTAERLVAQLKAHLRSRPGLGRLPSEWIVLASLPRTAAGEIDRSGLPRPEEANRRYVAPRTPLERGLVELWQEQLGIERVGIDDNYFTLGGDSIRSISLVAKGRERGIDVAIKDLFAHPTVSALAVAIERGEARGDEITREVGPFELLTASERERLDLRTDLEDAYPLSLLQQGMVLESLRHPDISVYQNVHCYQFSEAWIEPQFEQALRHLMIRHPMLRTVYDFSAERPLQLVRKEPRVELAVTDVRHLDEDAIRETIDQWMRRRSAEPLELSSSLWKLAIFVVGERSFVFGMLIHHAQWDGWSLESFATELYATYGALRRGGRIAEGRSLPSHRQFIALEQLALASPEPRAYWMRKLDGATVPWWAGREKSGGASISCDISPQTGRSLTELARALGVQEKSVWCGVYLALLSLLSGTDEGLGTVITQGRPEIPDGDKVIGVFLNALPLRVRMSGSWADLIAATDRELREQHAFRHFPLAEIGRASGLDFSAAMFSYSSWHMYHEGIDREGTRQEWVPRKVGGWQETNYLLNVFVHKDEQAKRCSLRIDADSRVFDAAFRERIRGYVANIVDAMARDASAVIRKSELLGNAERLRQLEGWNETRRPYPEDSCIQERFEEWALAAPERIALVDRERELTYGELNRRADRLAQELVSRGVGPEVRVGLCLPRSAELVIGMLGILKAGGCYVPLEPDYPRQRLDYLLEDARIDLVITEPGVAGRVGGAGRQLLLLEETAEAGSSADAQFRVHARARGLRPDHPAYLIYTSASTGAPKGVLGPHRGIVNRVHWLESTRGIGGEEILCQKTSVGFVDHVAEIFQALSAGVPLVILAPETVREPKELLRDLDARCVTQLTLVPSLLKTLLEGGAGEQARHIKYIHCSGEALHASGLDGLGHCFPRARLFNIYGSTEVGADVTCQPVALPAGNAPAAEWAPIGKPIDNSQVYILDAECELAVTGAVGELHVGGVCLARGYFQRARITAEKFVPHPFAEQAGERLYRTGDLVRWRSDGTLEYLGRADTQVKVRGVRIELGEIENALRAQEGIREAVVVARGGPGDLSLVGYVVPTVGSSAEEARIVERLREQLPGNLIPSALVVLEALPLTPNGKLDRLALPAPAASRTSSAPPEGQAEELLAQLWCVLLKRERVGRHDSFFELGGHSLLATQLTSRIREAFSVELPVREVFEHTTLSSQAAAIERARGDALQFEPPMQALSRERPLPLSFAQQRLWFLHQYMGPSAVYNMPLALRLQGDVDEASLVHALAQIYRRHESLRTRFETLDGNPVQWTDPPTLELEVEPMSPADARAQARAERSHCFDLSRERLCRIRLLREIDGAVAGDYVLLVTMHHAVSDGWSLGIFFRELVDSYRARARGAETELAPLPIQYADFAQWQRGWLQGERLERQVSYWRAQLAGLPPLLTLPTDRPRPSEQTFRGSLERFALSAELSRELRALSREQGVTLYMTLLSAFAVLLGRYAGQDDVGIGTPIANRTRRETEGLIGLFVNTLVMRHDLSADPRFVDLLKHTRTMALQAYANQDVPFERLVEELNPERSRSHSPLFQVSFAFQNVPFESLEIPGVAVRPLQSADEADAPQGTARFDLTLNLQESPEGLLGLFEYNTDLFDRGTVRRLWTHYARLLEAIVKMPKARLSHLEFLGAGERHRQLVDWNATDRAYPTVACLHGLFEARARLQPDAVALVCEGGELTYGELDRRADRFAHRLIARGVSPGDTVGLCLPRSLEMVIALLGILKAGGAYVPLDPHHPPARLAHAVEDSGLSLMVGDLPALTPSCVTVEDHPGEVPASGDLPAHPPADALAYVIYTSGSTGRPKGVRLSHGNVVNFMLAMREQLGVRTQDRLLAVTTLSFDIALLELYLPLVVGATVHIAPAQSLADGERLIELLEESRITVLQATPVTWKLLLDSGWPGQRDLTALVGGEAFPRELASRLTGKVRRTWNLYGPTETAIWSTSFRVAEAVETASVPIGRPICNTQVYVLDRHRRLVPDGVVGELYIGGAGVSQGYSNRPALTAERFLPDPFAATQGSRLYRTGDLARWRCDGTLEYLARVDTQVKLRGFRIELGEIESVLLAHQGVRDAVAVVREDAGDKRLVGYVVVGPAAPADEATLLRELRVLLQEQLPAYMVPSTLIVLTSLPLTANGKVDRRALPAPEVAPQPEYAPPEGPTEVLLAHLWSELLKCTRIGRYDDFFALGGHSLLATQLTTRIQRAFDVEIAVASVFQHHVLMEMAAFIDREIEIARLDGDAIDHLSEEEAARLLQQLEQRI